jgi:hypothetical protein
VELFVVRTSTWALALVCLGHAANVQAQVPAHASVLARLTGIPKPGETYLNPNDTAQTWAVLGTDLGLMWDDGNGKILAAYGDTFASPSAGAGPPPFPLNWRSNSLSRSTDRDPTDGLTLDSMAVDSAGSAREILRSQTIPEELTVLPNGGVSVGQRQYLHIMSVRKFVGVDWLTNFSTLAYSDDDGETWRQDGAPRWENNPEQTALFQEAALVRHAGFVYLFGEPNGRLGDIYLARVDENQLLDASAYEYWNGEDWSARAPNQAVPIVAGPAGEMSVVYNSYYQKWIMSYLDVGRDALVTRTADTLIGPWSGASLLVSGRDFPSLYGPFIHPWFNDGPELYFVMSTWSDYNVFWMHAELECECAS